eukprot:TRINITY_DN7238_c0_g1_i2.p1 TRINITY_DN7238_c0_g1~~TRINITY_DN7238_c0_g1_i2.p1  ORF type:complete len:411 (+),score=91.83 TRINITY_DN7238_c0_g1_i2:78-1310(+)
MCIRDRVCTAVSNGNFVLRYEAEGRVPVTHTMEWHREPERAVCAMCLDPSAKVLLCCTVGGAVFLLPVHELITTRSDTEPCAQLSELAKASASALGPTMLHMCSQRDASGLLQLPQRKGRVVQCIWWPGWDGQPLGVLAFSDGALEVVSLSQLTVLRSLKVRAQLTGMALVEDPQGQYADVLLHSAHHGVFQLTLGLQVGARGFHTLLSHPHEPGFNPLWVSGEKEQLGAQATVSVQRAAQGPLIGALRRGDKHASRLEVFDSELSSPFALYIYSLFPSVTMAAMAGSFLFTVSGTHKLRFSVVSRLLAERSDSQTAAHPSEACMQQFTMDPNQSILGLLHCPGSHDGQLLESQDGGHDTVYVWSHDTVYECCLLYTSDAADEEDSVDLGGRRILKKKKITKKNRWHGVW